MHNETKEDFAKYRLSKSKETLKSAQLLYDNNDLTGANNKLIMLYFMQ